MGDKERAKVCVRQSERVHRVAQGAGVTMSSLGEGFGKGLRTGNLGFPYLLGQIPLAAVSL